MLTGAVRPASTDSANGVLRSESVALLHFRLVKGLHLILGQKIDVRLIELGEMLPQGRTFGWGYPFFVVLLGQVLVTHLEARP